MAKIARTSTAQKPAKDLFSELPEAAPRRLAGKETRLPGECLALDLGRQSVIEVLDAVEPDRDLRVDDRVDDRRPPVDGLSELRG